MRNLAKDRFQFRRVCQPRYFTAEINRVYGISKPKGLRIRLAAGSTYAQEDPAADGGETSLSVAYSESETASDSGRLGNTSCEL